MENDRSSEKFSRIGYCSIIDNDGKVLWSNNKRLFKRVAECERFITARRSLAGTHLSFECKLTFEGVRFRISSIPIPDKRLLCMAFPEDCYIRYAYSEMYMRIFNIRKNSSRSLTALGDIIKALEAAGAPDEVIGAIDEQLKLSEEIFRESVSIGRLFDNEHICDYVRIEERLKHSAEQVKKYDSVVGRSVSFDISFSHKVARINYPVLETALLEIVRIIYKSLPEGGSTVISVRDDISGKIVIFAELGLRSGFDASQINGEVRDIMCAFECLDGRTRIYLVNDRLVIKAEAPAPLSNYIHRVKPDGYYVQHAEELKGYSSVLAPDPHYSDNDFILHSPKAEVEISMCALMADILFSGLAQTY